MDIDELYFSLHTAAKRADGGISGVARRLTIREQVLVNKLNPNSTDSEPKLSEFVRVLRDVGSTEPLEILCAMFGGQFVTKSNQSGESLMGALLHAMNEMSDIAKVGEAAMADGRLTSKESRQWLHEIWEARDELTRLENTIQAHKDKRVSLT
ncbi:MAG: hypothetical protein JAY88_14645 [Candidatus Thiodiazotropha lotti]|nr:hypothetical protein [Candidatus Thiodiazotropha lotti]MCW4188302.1 hypothetical protein [Candidatus Thiodiazotropha lotti]